MNKIKKWWEARHARACQRGDHRIGSWWSYNEFVEAPIVIGSGTLVCKYCGYEHIIDGPEPYQPAYIPEGRPGWDKARGF